LDAPAEDNGLAIMTPPRIFNAGLLGDLFHGRVLIFTGPRSIRVFRMIISAGIYLVIAFIFVDARLSVMDVRSSRSPGLEKVL
jgi:hypothetical protein